MELKTIDLYQTLNITPPPGASAVLRCYIQRPSDEFGPGRTQPGVLIFPGGGYRIVSEREAVPIALRFLARGWSAFILTYSVAPYQFPTALREAAMAMRYLRENAAAFGITQVAAMGFSAGAHLCGTLGTLWDAPEVADIAPPALLRPDALGLCYPVAVSWGATHEGSFQNLCGSDQALRARLSLDSCVRPDMPPVFLWHTRDDDTVPVRNSLILAQRLEEAGVDFAMHIYRQGAHGLSTADERSYGVGKVPPVSWDVPGWLEAQIRFFGDLGMKPADPVA